MEMKVMCEGVNWIHQTQDREPVMKLGVPYKLVVLSVRDGIAQSV